MISRNLEKVLLEKARFYPVVTLTGPRQSGKSTLARASFPSLPWVNLENPDLRGLAQGDPRLFLSNYPQGAILDEIQRAPEIPSFLMGIVDDDPTAGRWVLTGSSNLQILSAVSQSLAGRTGLVSLLTCSLDELRGFPRSPGTLYETLFEGGYPAIHDRGIPASMWLGDYAATYVERDVHQLLRVGDLGTFGVFMGLVAGRVGQLVNLSGLGSDAGVAAGTIRVWLQVLEASYLVLPLRPWKENRSTSLVKTPKLVFPDTGLMVHLLGIRSAEVIPTHPLRGAIFENWVVSEAIKAFINAGARPPLSFFRDRKGLEVDLVIETSKEIWLVEAKSSHTLSSDFSMSLRRVAELRRPLADVRLVVVYGGDQRIQGDGVTYLPWFEWPTLLEEAVTQTA